MKKLVVSGLFVFLSVVVFGQNTTDSAPDIGDYYLKDIKEKPYDKSLLDSVDNTRIAIIPPEHFVFAKDIPGYLHPGTSASIQVKDVDGTSWPVIDKVMTKEHFESQGVKFIDRKEVELSSGLSGVIYTLSFEAKGVEFERKMMFAGSYNYTIWLNANYPASLKKTVLKPIMSSLLSADIIER
ncbi:MAG: hypothetical protein ACQES0_00725 [Bacteroidota bacterium]